MILIGYKAYESGLVPQIGRLRGDAWKSKTFRLYKTCVFWLILPIVISKLFKVEMQ